MTCGHCKAAVESAIRLVERQLQKFRIAIVVAEATRPCLFATQTGLLATQTGLVTSATTLRLNPDVPLGLNVDQVTVDLNAGQAVVVGCPTDHPLLQVSR